MTSHYDNKTERWIVSEGNITVKGPNHQGCEERLREMASRYQTIRSLREPKPEDLA